MTTNLGSTPQTLWEPKSTYVEATSLHPLVWPVAIPFPWEMTPHKPGLTLPWGHGHRQAWRPLTIAPGGGPLKLPVPLPASDPSLCPQWSTPKQLHRAAPSSSYLARSGHVSEPRPPGRHQGRRLAPPLRAAEGTRGGRQGALGRPRAQQPLSPLGGDHRKQKE